MGENKLRTFNRRQALENQRFLAALARSGNTRLAARELGYHRSTFIKRRNRSAAFAAEWDGALAAAHARLNAPAGGGAGALPRVIRLANGRLQLRQAPARLIDARARQAFLAALSATANVRLSARTAGFAHSSFYRLRDYDPGIAREMRMALQEGYDRIELALLAACDPDSYRDDAWRTNEPPELPLMSNAQALQLLYLHQKEARLWQERPDRRRRRGEGSEYSARLARKWHAEKAADREGYEVVQALLTAGPVPAGLEPARPDLPALDQVTGWSKARADPPDPFAPALFGGWRLEDWQRGE